MADMLVLEANAVRRTGSSPVEVIWSLPMSAKLFEELRKLREQENKFAQLASDKLSVHSIFPTNHRNVWERVGFVTTAALGPYEKELLIQVCQYDDKQAVINALNQAGCNMVSGMVLGLGVVWHGSYDLTNDPDFAQSEQKKYRIIIEDYDAHFGGY